MTEHTNRTNHDRTSILLRRFLQVLPELRDRLENEPFKKAQVTEPSTTLPIIMRWFLIQIA